MTNAEKWKDKLLELEEIAVSKEDGRPYECGDLGCGKCKLGDSCADYLLIEWLLAECKEPHKLNQKERMLCELLDTGWIARDMDSFLFFYKNKPRKTEEYYADDSGYSLRIDDNFKDCKFDFIKWQDPEPRRVEDLLQLEVKG